MSTPADQELRELDAFIAEHVTGWKKPAIGFQGVPHYTTDPAAAMQVLEKCAELAVVTIEHDGNSWLVARLSQSNSDYQEDFCKVADSLPLAICQFAKQLFSK